MIRLYRYLFDELGVKWTRRFLEKTMDESSYRWSIFGVSVVLRKYGIETQCVRFNDKEDIAQEQNPCVIIYMNKFAVLNGVKNGVASLYMESGETKQVTETALMQGWNGVALICRATAISGEPQYQEHIKAEKISCFKKCSMAFGALAFIVIAIIGNGCANEIYWWCALVVNAIGISVSYLLLQKDLHIANKLSDKLCGMVSKSHGCDNVLNSAQAYLFGLVKFSEIGGSFFLVNLISLLFFPAVIPYVAIISVIVLPFSFWSLWFQKFKAKQWCALCLSTLALMWAQAIVYVLGGAVSFSAEIIDSAPQIMQAASLVLGYILVCLGLNAVMEHLKEYRKYKMMRKEYFNLKLDNKVVKAFEESAEKFETEASRSSSMIFGSPDAQTTITILSNPYCGPCAKMHDALKYMPGENVNIQYILSSFSDEKSIINKYLIAAYQQLGAERTWEIMTEWYGGGKKDGEKFFAEYGLDIDRDEVKEEFDKHAQWRKDDRLYGTPTVIINGNEVSYPYSVEDYMYL